MLGDPLDGQNRGVGPEIVDYPARCVMVVFKMRPRTLTGWKCGPVHANVDESLPVGKCGRIPVANVDESLFTLVGAATRERCHRPTKIARAISPRYAYSVFRVLRSIT